MGRWWKALISCGPSPRRHGCVGRCRESVANMASALGEMKKGRREERVMGGDEMGKPNFCLRKQTAAPMLSTPSLGNIMPEH